MSDLFYLIDFQNNLYLPHLAKAEHIENCNKTAFLNYLTQQCEILRELTQELPFWVNVTTLNVNKQLRSPARLLRCPAHSKVGYSC